MRSKIEERMQRLEAMVDRADDGSRDLNTARMIAAAELAAAATLLACDLIAPQQALSLGMAAAARVEPGHAVDRVIEEAEQLVSETSSGTQLHARVDALADIVDALGGPART